MKKVLKQVYDESYILRNSQTIRWSTREACKHYRNAI